MEMTIVIALLIVISVLVGIKLRMEYENDDRLRSILRRLNETEKPESETFTDKQKEDILYMIDQRIINYDLQLKKIINNLEKNTLSSKPIPFPPPPDSFFRKPSESSPRK